MKEDPAERWKRVREMVIGIIDDIDLATKANPNSAHVVEPQWWSDMMEARRMLAGQTMLRHQRRLT